MNRQLPLLAFSTRVLQGDGKVSYLWQWGGNDITDTLLPCCNGKPPPPMKVKLT